MKITKSFLEKKKALPGFSLFPTQGVERRDD